MTLIKICGITSWRDAKAAVDAGADMLGFACDAHSERAIGVDTFTEFASRIPKRIIKVGVFDNTPHPAWAQNRETLRQFDRLQYYDSTVWSKVVGENWDMRRKIRAFHVTREADLRRIAQCNDLVQAFLVNVHVPSDVAAYSESTGWDLAMSLHQFGKHLYLAGGLNHENVATAIKRVRPYAVDVTVGVESAPGVKDLEKMRAFVTAVRSASQ